MTFGPLVYVATEGDGISRLFPVTLREGNDRADTEDSVPRVRLRASDLQEAQRLSGAFSARERRATSLLLDVEVSVAETARKARHELSCLVDANANASSVPRVIRYVGTVDGLMGLIHDVRAVGIADGVVLIPLFLHSPEKDMLKKCLTATVDN